MIPAGYPAQMVPAGYPAQMVPLQGWYDGVPGQPVGATVVQHTTVNISSKPPKDHIIWSIFNFVYSNFFCLGLAALIFSVKSRDRKMAGDLEGARHHGSTARRLNIAATILGVIALIIFIVIICVTNIFAIFYSFIYSYSYSNSNSYSNSYGNRYDNRYDNRYRY